MERDAGRDVMRREVHVDVGSEGRAAAHLEEGLGPCAEPTVNRRTALSDREMRI
jgi:hypothetical protein